METVELANVKFTTPRGNPAEGSAPRIRHLAAGERVHFSENGVFCFACLCDLAGAAWTDRKDAWFNRTDRCS